MGKHAFFVFYSLDLLGHPILPYGFKPPFVEASTQVTFYYLADAQVLSDEWSPVVLYGGESVVHYAPGCHFCNGESCHYVRIKKGHCEGLPGVYMVYRKRLMLRSCVHFNSNLVNIFDVGFMTFPCNFRALVYELVAFSRMKKLLFFVATCKPISSSSQKEDPISYLQCRNLDSRVHSKISAVCLKREQRCFGCEFCWLFLFLPPTCISGWAARLLLSCWNSVS